MSARYQPGRLLARLRHEFPGFECHDLDRGAVRFSASGTSFDVREIVETHFLMHTVIAQFELAVSAPPLDPLPSRILVRHAGALTRRGVEFQSPASDATLLEALRADADLTTALMPLDFTHCELSAETTGWRLRLRHFGASEVVGRLPALSRYIPLVAAQRESLLAAFRGFERALARSVKFQAH